MGSMNFGLFPMLKRFTNSSTTGNRRRWKPRAISCSATPSRISNTSCRPWANPAPASSSNAMTPRISITWRISWSAAWCKPPLFVQTVFGILGGIGPHPEDVLHMKRTADRLFGDEYKWSVLGAGRNQLPIAAQAAAMGGNVRVGLEDSLWAGRGRLAQSNAEQVRTGSPDHRRPGPQRGNAGRGPRHPVAERRRSGRVLIANRSTAPPAAARRRGREAKPHRYFLPRSRRGWPLWRRTLCPATG